MKAVFIVYNMALTEQVERVLSRLGIRGFTSWEKVSGTGTDVGEPHLGTHTWPAVNSARLIILDEAGAADLLEQLHILDEKVPEQGLRAFCWSIDSMV